MKALYFTKIDYIRSRMQMGLIFVLLAIVTLIMKFMTDSTDVTIFLYGIFVMIVFSTVPFGNCTRADAGFLQLLPAATWQRVLGRFLYGLSQLFIGCVISVICMAVYQSSTGDGIKVMDLSFGMIVLAAGLLIMTVQYTILYLIGEIRGRQFISLVRMVPGMCFFFGSIKLLGTIRENPAAVTELLELVDNRMDMIGWGGMAIALAVMAAGIIVCTKATEKKDF